MDRVCHIVRGCIYTLSLESLHIKHISFEATLSNYISTECNILNNTIFQTQLLNMLTSVSLLDILFRKQLSLVLLGTLICPTLKNMLLEKKPKKRKRKEKNKTEQNRTEKNKIEQNRTQHNTTQQNRTEQSRTEHKKDRTEHNTTLQNTNEQNRTEQNRTEQNRTE